MNKVPPPPAVSATINVLEPMGLGVTTAVGVGVGLVDVGVGPIDLEARTIAVEVMEKDAITVNKNNDHTKNANLIRSIEPDHSYNH